MRKTLITGMASLLLGLDSVHASIADDGALPADWHRIPLTGDKRPTEYRIEREGGKPVIHAHAASAAMALAHEPPADWSKRPLLRWRWKISHPLEHADNRVGPREDAAARVVLSFDGDRNALGLFDQAALAIGSQLAGREMAYATLMYIWSSHDPIGTVIDNPHTSRVKMIVVANGPGGVWQSATRNWVEDYRHSFGEGPIRLTGYGVLTDTDNTGETVDAWYGDISFDER
ncbi:DUF3047 domain-containing protein [Niveibacterium sp.]|uniref:DUF3047 domain-containing protein n=1 Tax=Niveibacterium sp. TaxID=2017444 RepID=UPI0035B3A3D7